MSKAQIITKAILAALGVYALVYLPNCFHLMTRSFLDQAILANVILFIVFSIITLLTVYFLAFNNNGLSCRIAGASNKLTKQEQTIWLINSLGLSLVFCGLMLLPGAIPALINVLEVPFLFLDTVNEIFVLKETPAFLELSASQWFEAIYDFLKALLALYLLFGAPHFVKWQIKNCERFNNEQPALVD